MQIRCHNIIFPGENKQKQTTKQINNWQKNIQGEEQQEEVMLMQVTVTNNDTVVTDCKLFLDEVNVIRWGWFQTTALLKANGFDSPVHHSPFGGCLLFTHIHMYIVIVSCFLLSSELFNVAIFTQGSWTLGDSSTINSIIIEQSVKGPILSSFLDLQILYIVV